MGEGGKEAHGWQNENVNEQTDESVNEGIEEDEVGVQSLHLAIIF